MGIVNEARVVATLERLYEQRGGSLADWGRHVVDAMLPLFDERRGIGVVMYDSKRSSCALLEVAGIPNSREVALVMMRAVASRFDPALYVTYFVTPRPVVMHSELQGLPLSENLALLASLGAQDMLGLVTEPEPGVGLALAVMRQRRSVSTRERAKLTRVALHLEASMRARLRPDSVLGTVSPSGRFDLGSDALDRRAREEVTGHVNAIERARLRANRGDGERALEAWHALTAGQVSLLERTEPGGKRLYEVCETAPRHKHLRALSPLEVNVLTDAARGLRNKEVAYALGLSQVRVSQALASVVDKLGMRSVHDAVRLAAGLRGVTGSLKGLDLLTASERDVAVLASSGLSNHEIAARRGTSTRTVANQLASILQKTGASSRRALGRTSA